MSPLSTRVFFWFCVLLAVANFGCFLYVPTSTMNLVIAIAIGAIATALYAGQKAA